MSSKERKEDRKGDRKEDGKEDRKENRKEDRKDDRKENRKENRKEDRKDDRKENRKEERKGSSPRNRDGNKSARGDKNQKQSSPRERDQKRSSPQESRSASPTRSPSPRSPRRGSRGYSTASMHRERRSANKIYRCPNTPPPGYQRCSEQNFVLDCNAVSSISVDYSKANPKFGQVLKPYNSLNDRSVQSYFRFDGVGRTLERNEQNRPGTSIEGKVVDRFHERGPGFIYLVRRNRNGAGSSMDTVNGHSEFLKDIKRSNYAPDFEPVLSYNGQFGYRRNTPWLRATPSLFGTGTSPVH